MKKITVNWRNGQRAARFTIPKGNYAYPVDLYLYRINPNRSRTQLCIIEFDCALDAWDFLQAWAEFGLRHKLSNPEVAHFLESIPT